MHDWYVLDENGEPRLEPDLLTAARFFETAERHVGDDTIKGVRISTVFLGLDHAHRHGAKPVLFETMIFAGNRLDGKCERYCTRAEALAGHQRHVEEVKAAFAAGMTFAGLPIDPDDIADKPTILEKEG